MIDFLKNTDIYMITSMLAKYYPFSESQLKKYLTLLPSIIKKNNSLKINFEIAEIIFANQYEFINSKNVLPIEFIIKYCDKLNWREAIWKNEKYVWDLDSIFRLQSRIDDYYFQYINLENLMFENEYDVLKFESILKVIDGDYIWQGVSKCKTIPWTTNRYNNWYIDLLEEFENKWDWKSLSQNTSLPWSIKLVSKFKNKWDWKELSKNRQMCWSNEFIITFKDKLYWKSINEPQAIRYLTLNRLVDWNTELLNNINKEISFYWLSRNVENISPEILLNYAEKWDWKEVSLNYQFKFEELAIFESYIDWDNLKIKWDINILRKYKHKLNWKEICSSNSIVWTEGLLTEFDNFIDWEILSSSSNINWRLELILCFENKIKWDVLSENFNFPWDLSLLKRFRDKVDWERICRNESIVWTEELLEEFVENVHWEIISLGNSIQLTPKLLENYHDKLNWESISKNTTIFWSEDLLSKFGYKLNWWELGRLSSIYDHVDISLYTLRYCNDLTCLMFYSELSNVKWSTELIVKYENYWDWERLSDNKSIKWESEILIKYKDKLNWSRLICTSKSTEFLNVLKDVNFFGDYKNRYEFENFNSHLGSGQAILYFNLIHPYINDEVIDDFFEYFKKIDSEKKISH